MDAQIIEVLPKTAKEFIEKWHYSNRCPTGKNIFLGWYIDGELYALADYGIGVNPFQAQSLCRLTSKEVTKENLLELKRLCRVEPKKEKKELTQFLSRCHKLLRARGYRYVVSFSDPHYGHNGGIYKAANFVHLGQTGSENHVIDKDGVIRHRRYYYRYARRKGITMEKAREELGLKFHRSEPKDRWFIDLGKRLKETS